MLNGNRKARKILKTFFVIIIFALIASACLSEQNITFEAYKNVRNKRVEEMKSFSYSTNKIEEANIDPGVKSQDAFSMDILDQSTFSIILVIIKNLSTLFSKLIVILSFFLFFLYIRGWIILVSQFKFRFFVMRYLQLVDGKKNQLMFQ